MKKIVYIIILCILFIPNVIFASDKKMNIYLFYGEGCPHCANEEKYLNAYLKEHKNITLHKYEVWSNEENQRLLKETKTILKNKASGIPFLVIGSSAIVGYSEDYTKETIEKTINYYKEKEYKDKVGIALGVINDDNSEEKTTSTYKENEVDLPVVGKKNAKNVSLILTTILIGLVDGFNPCAMWILIFLISMLLGMENRRRMWTLGITFLLSSAIVYFLFLISWLDLAIFLNKVMYIRLTISLLAVIFGAYTVIKFFTVKKEDGCEVVDSKNRKKIIASIKKIVKEKTFILALLGIVLLAISVNVIELLCSLGLPVTFTQILAINEVSKSSQIMYSLLYVLFFLIDDIIIFIIAMKTLEIKAISNKYGKYSHLIGGIIMLIIGVLMLYKPEWLMFNF